MMQPSRKLRRLFTRCEVPIKILPSTASSNIFNQNFAQWRDQSSSSSSNPNPFSGRHLALALSVPLVVSDDRKHKPAWLQKRYSYCEEGNGPRLAPVDGLDRAKTKPIKRKLNKKRPTMKMMHTFGASTTEIENQPFHFRRIVDDTPVFAMGSGTCKSWALFGKGPARFCAVLYLKEHEQEEINEQTMLRRCYGESPRSIEFCFLQDEKQKSLADEFLLGFTRNATNTNGPVNPQAVPQSEILARGFRDVNKGDRIRIDYCPTNGITMFYKRAASDVLKTGEWELLSVVPQCGPDFGRAVFAVWFGEWPLDEDFREQILKGNFGK